MRNKTNRHGFAVARQRDHFLRRAREPAWARRLTVWAHVLGLGGYVAFGKSPDPPVFTDVTVAAGVDYVQYVTLPNPPEPRGLIAMTGGAAAGDYDGDGAVDLFVTRFGEPNILFRNRGDGTFKDVTARSFRDDLLTSNGAGWGDIDNDGDLDLYVTAVFDKRFYLFVNDGRGRFTEQGMSRGAAVPGQDDHFGFSVTFGDYDLDGWVDIHTTEWRMAPMNPSEAPANARLLRNRGRQGPGVFDDVTASAGVVLDGVQGTQPGSFSFASRFADMNNDGWPDLVIAGDFSTSRLFWNNGDGTFTDGTASAGVGTDENGMGSAVGDFDGDGFLDWFVTSVFDEDETCDKVECNWSHSGNRLYRNEGNQTFSDATDTFGVRNGFWGWGAAFLDHDNDADLDLIMTNGVDFPDDAHEDPFHFDPMRLWRNDDGIGTEVSESAGIVDNRSGKGLLTFDYDDDGDLDVFVVNNTNHPVLYRNDGGNDSDWLRVKTIGRFNRQGLGARVRVTPVSGGPTQMREIDAGSHFLGQSDPIAHFGLGQGSGRVDVQIRWPGTFTLQTLHNVRRNKTLVVEEPEPPLTLRINGRRPRSRVDVVPGIWSYRLTLDTAAGPFKKPLDWYLAYRVRGQAWKWLQDGEWVDTRVPFQRGVRVRRGSHELLRSFKWPWNRLTFLVALFDGDEMVALDFIACE